MEEWRQSFVPIWEVSNFGNVRNKKTQYILKPHLHNGYRSVYKYSADGTKKIKVHRLVCIAFNGDDNDPTKCIDHIDGDKLNNHSSNLRWFDFFLNSKKGNKPERFNVDASTQTDEVAEVV
jgi:hypothetical protein